MEQSFLSYNDLMNQKDFEYFFRFKKMETNFEELWRMKSTARESLKEWLLAIHSRPETAEVISNAASELIENSIKYSSKSTYSFVFINVLDKIITIETVNRSALEQKQILKDFLEYVSREDKNPGQIYIERITESIKTGKSQVGLVKILMETGGTVELIEEEGDIIHVIVKMQA